MSTHTAQCLRLVFEVAALVRLGCGSRHGGCNIPTAAQQGAAPDRLQLRSLRSFLASVSALPAAGELGRCAVARYSLGSAANK